MTDILKADHPECISAAVSTLKRGFLIVYPTDTVYGLGALATNFRAVQRLFLVKKRNPKQPLPILLADTCEMERVVSKLPSLALPLAENFWPGALTIVLPVSPDFQSPALAGKDSVAIRVPNQPILRRIIRSVGEPITGTSANLSGMATPLTVESALEQVSEHVETAIDNGPSKTAIASTIIDITNDAPVLLREGPIDRCQLERVTGAHIVTAAGAEQGKGIKKEGQ